MPENFYNAKTIKQIEQAAMRELAISEYDLMRRAAQTALDFLLQRWPQAARLAVVCGSGNNGGDGYELAARALKLGVLVDLWALGAPKTVTAQSARQAFERAGGKVRKWSKAADFGRSSVVVDALLGTGLSSAPRGSYKTAIEMVKEAKVPVLALDVPSGLQADNGHIEGACITAAATVSFVAKKPGLYTAQGVDVVGERVFDSLGVPVSVYRAFSPLAKVVDVVSGLPPLARSSHKGTLGKLQIIGGAPGMMGAVILSGKAAARTGAGLVQVFSHADHAALVSVAAAELMTQAVSEPVDDKVLGLQMDSDAMLLGCGLGQSEWSQQLFEAALENAKRHSTSLVVDADGLNWLAKAPQYRVNWVLTPHPKEAACLLGADVGSVQADRFTAAKEISEKYGGVCVLKGAGTVVADAGGAKQRCFLNTTGNPGLATGGTGDVLAGMIAGLLAQGLAPEQAAIAGVWLHGEAADRVVKKIGQRSLMAMDLVDELGYILRRFDTSSKNLE